MRFKILNFSFKLIFYFSFISSIPSAAQSAYEMRRLMSENVHEVVLNCINQIVRMGKEEVEIEEENFSLAAKKKVERKIVRRNGNCR